MKKISLIWIIVFVCAGMINAVFATDNKKILVLGDSISTAYGMDYEKGWVNLLKQRLEQNSYLYDVVNASITGDVSASGRERIEKLLDEHRPELVIIELGGNDGLRGLPISELKANLQRMIDVSKQQSAGVLLAGMRILPNYGPQYTQAFANVYTDLAQDDQVILVPFILEGIGGVSDMMQSDGIHPNEQAQAIILNNIWPLLEQQLE